MLQNKFREGFRALDIKAKTSSKKALHPMRPKKAQAKAYLQWVRVSPSQAEKVDYEGGVQVSDSTPAPSQ